LGAKAVLPDQHSYYRFLAWLGHSCQENLEKSASLALCAVWHLYPTTLLDLPSAELMSVK
jgi:hypothetical protein